MSVIFQNYILANNFLDYFIEDEKFNKVIPNNRTNFKDIIKQVDFKFSTENFKKFT